MGALKNFAIEAEAAGADPERAFKNLSSGMLWQQAIDEAMPAPEDLDPEESFYDAIRFACFKPES